MSQTARNRNSNETDLHSDDRIEQKLFQTQRTVQIAADIVLGARISLMLSWAGVKQIDNRALSMPVKRRLAER